MIKITDISEEYAVS